MANGSRTRPTDTVSTSGIMATSMRASGTCACATDKAQISFRTAISISVSTLTVKPMDMASTDGPTATPIQASSSKA